MNDEQQVSTAKNASSAGGSRRTWTSPRLARIKAGEAETGANPVQPEGPIAKGS